MAARGIAYRLWTLIETERLERGWSAVKMAEHIGLPRNTIKRLQESPHPPQPATVNTIADALGLDRKKARTLAGIPVPTTDEEEKQRRTEHLVDDIKLILDEAALPEQDRLDLAAFLMEEWEREEEESRRRRVDHARRIAEAWLRARGA